MTDKISPRFVVKHIGRSLKRANTRPKPAKELAYPNAQKTAKLIANRLKMNKGQLVTRNINKLAVSGLRRFRLLIMFKVN
tara:strand:- start:39 stop:278 length:240 start_codon:yes stop_codon:yes gene_type:complete